MNKRFWLVIVAVCVIFVAFLAFRGDGGDKAATSSKGQPTSHVIGQGKSGVNLVEYADYQCEYCAYFAPVVKQVAEKYNEQITFQFRNLALTQIHQNTLAAARAAEAAGMQGKFWEMHDLIFANQADWRASTSVYSTFQVYAQRLGLSVQQFKSDYGSEKVNASINADRAEFMKTGFEEATPTFILDGKQIKPDATVESFSKLIDAEIAKKSKQ
jgi:protein-disulfide isomerase